MASLLRSDHELFAHAPQRGAVLVLVVAPSLGAALVLVEAAAAHLVGEPALLAVRGHRIDEARPRGGLGDLREVARLHRAEPVRIAPAVELERLEAGDDRVAAGRT